MGAGAQNSGPEVCIANTLPTDLSPQFLPSGFKNILVNFFLFKNYITWCVCALIPLLHVEVGE